MIELKEDRNIQEYLMKIDGEYVEGVLSNLYTGDGSFCLLSEKGIWTQRQLEQILDKLDELNDVK